jgi:murein DD-endopeptidase MepM/ murein hydrolase activator NlpD
MRLLKYLSKKLHIVVIREARHSVFRLRIGYSVLYFLGICFVAFTVYTFTISSLHSETYVSLVSYKNKLENVTQSLEDVTREKTEAVDNLQNEIIKLSNQSELMKSKITEMMKNEEYLRSIVLNEDSSNSILAYSNDIDINNLQENSDTYVGGSLIPVNSDEIFNLAKNTSTLYENLFEQLDILNEKMSANIEDAEQKILDWRITPSIWPSYSWNVTSRFGYRADPFTGKSAFHSGIDFAGNIGDSVFSTADGVVVKAASDLSHGRNIIIQHSTGLRTRYLHLSKIKVNVGDSVKKGDVIGLVGNTGRSTGPHLHYEVIKNGVNINPAPYLQTSREEAINVRKEKEIRP